MTAHDAPTQGVTTMNDLQAARLDAANALAEADARCRAAEHPDSNATAEDGREARAARAEAQRRYDEADAELSGEIDARKRYETRHIAE